MASSVYYVQPCPACSRNQQVRVSYLGKGIECQHCGADFIAQDPESQESCLFDSEESCHSESGITLLDRADQLLLQLAKERQAVLDAREAGMKEVPA